MSQLLNLTQNCFDYNKLYIGQLPLSITEQFIRDVLSKLTEVRDVRIIKGDARGTFDRFCYAFAMVKGTEEICAQIIKKVNQQYPEWKINVKVDNDRFKFMQSQQNNPRQNQPPNTYYQQQHQQVPQQPHRMNYDMNKQPQQNYYQRPNYPPQHIQHPTSHHNYQQPGQGQNFGNQGFYGGGMVPQFASSQSLTSVNEPEKIIGEKQNKILVREIWLGGIPEMCDKYYMQQLMSEFGIIQNLQIFPKFAFIKFRMVDQATLAYERAQRIYSMFGSPPGFRILFSDPSRRANIVSNHYQYDRQSPFLPVLFLGFPPVTSATIDLDLMRSICEKYGPIVNSYMRKNSNNQTRSYFLFTFDNIKSALRAKAELNKRRDLLGDKRAQVTLLLDEEVILRGRDLSHTERMFQGDANQSIDKKKPSTQRQFQKNFEKPHFGGSGQYPNYPPKQMTPMPNMPNVPYGYPPGMHYGNYILPTNPAQTYPPDMYYLQQQQQNYYDPKFQKQGDSSRTTDVHKLLESVLDKPSTSIDRKDEGNEKKPIKSRTTNQQSVTDIVSKMLGSDKDDHYEKEKQREPTWSGFLTWKGAKRIGVDGHTQFKQPQDYAINIMNLIEYKDIVMKQKATMILEPSSPIYEAQFKQFTKALRMKVGVSFTSTFLMYIMAKTKESDEIKQIRDNELLVVMQKTSLGSLIRDKLQKCEELK